MFPHLQSIEGPIETPEKVQEIYNSEAFQGFGAINVMPLIYNEDKKQCNIMVFDHEKAKLDTRKILLIGKGETFGGKARGKTRKHPIYLFLDKDDNYICEVRYGGASANALQRGLWTNTKNAKAYFDSMTNGWIDYSHNMLLVRLFSLALNSTPQGHEAANQLLQQDIDKLRAI